MSRTMSHLWLAIGATGFGAFIAALTGFWPARLIWLAWLIAGSACGFCLACEMGRQAHSNLTHATAPVIRTDATGHVASVSEPAAAIFGAPVDDLIGQRVQIGDDIAWPERLAAIAELTLGIAHELRNPLTAIRNAAQLGQMFADPAKKDSLFEEVISGADRLNDSIDELSKFAMSNPGPLQPVRLDQVVAAALAQIKGILIMRDIKVDCAFSGRLPLVRGDEQQLKQALLNIFHSSIGGMPGGGALIIRTTYLSDCKQLELSIGDTGAGIAPKAVPRVFRPFSGSDRSGSSVGLTIASQIIVQGHNGTISCQSWVGGGTRIRVLLPVCDGQNAGRGSGQLSADNE